MDTDGDGVNDGKDEVLGGTYLRSIGEDPDRDPVDLDWDDDGLYSALDPDSDEDGLWDGEELDLGTDPWDADTDGDGVGDGDDVDPLVGGDVDDDGLPDEWEAFYGATDPLADDDGDGLANLLEFQEGTSPVHAFGLDEGVFVDLSRLVEGDTITSMIDLYMPLADGNRLDDMGRPLFQVDPTTPARYWRLFDLKTWTGMGWEHQLPRTGTVMVPGDPSDIGEWPAYIYGIEFAGPWKGPLPAPLHSQVVVGVEPGVVTRTFGTFTARTYIDGYSITSPQLQLQEYLEKGLSSNSRDLPPFDQLPGWGTDLPPELNDATGRPDIEATMMARRYLWDRATFSNDQENWPLSSPYNLVRDGEGTSLDFASSLTVLCRLLDVPARVAVGFAPGIILGGHRVVRMGDLHVWTEIYDGNLWIPVEATPYMSTNGLGMGVAGADESVYLDTAQDGNGTVWLPAAGGALTSGSGGVTLPDDDEDTDGDGVLDRDDDDDDNDGIPDAEEWALGTNPIDPDTDHDLLEDGSELLNGTSPVNGDSDGDGVADGVEVILLGTDPLDRDTDGAGSCDIQELEYNTDPLDPEDDYIALDADCDGIPDAEELRLGTDPDSWDSDLDGLSDGLEVELGSDPINWDTDGDEVPDGEELDRRTDLLVRDTDLDGLTDGEELGYVPTYLVHPSDPNRPDTDGDGIPDGREVALDMRPDHVDVDGDGLTDDREMELRSDPYDIDSDGDGIDDWEEAQRMEFEEEVDAARDGLIPIYIALVVLSLAFAVRYRPFDKRIVPDVIERLSELERWLATLKEAPDDEVRRAIYKAYDGLTDILADHGYLERKEGWTAREFERAVFEALPWVPDDLLRELTRLFEEARFSDHELPPDYVERARTCLAGIREALEEVVGRPGEAAMAEAAA
jgi:transglutaminase-like putative cysteine protease